VISVGCIDFSIFGRQEAIPEHYRTRNLYAWNPETTLMRTTPEESTQLGKLVAERANAAQGPVAVILPLAGCSQVGMAGQAFRMPQADEALFSAIRANLHPEVKLIEMDTHINDPRFAEEAAQIMLNLMGQK
jgi:uncharacterized protein (UPF0261 family)